MHVQADIYTPRCAHGTRYVLLAGYSETIDVRACSLEMADVLLIQNVFLGRHPRGIPSGQPLESVTEGLYVCLKAV